MLQIKNNYKEYNIREIAFDNPDEDFFNIGKYIASSKGNQLLKANGFSDEDDFGFNIYISNYDSSKKLKIYRTDNKLTYKYYYHHDDRFIAKLQVIQPNVKYTEFPTGVVTMDNKIIGIEEPFYSNVDTFLKELKDGMDKEDALYYIHQMLDIISELYNNGIIYCDLHPDNFLVDKENKLLHLIDFDEKYVFFRNEEKTNSSYQDMIENFYTQIINQTFNILNIPITIKDVNTLEDLYDIIDLERVR